MIRRSTPSFNCNECDKVYYKKFEFYEHWNIHSKQTPFKCGTCSECFSLIDDYVYHYKSEHLKFENSKVSKQKFDKSLEKSTIASKHFKPRNFSKSKSTSKGSLGKINKSYEFAKPKDLRKSDSSENSKNLINGAKCGDNVLKGSLGKERLGNDNSNAHKCQKCSKIFDDSEDFKKHLKEHSQNFSPECSSDEDVSDDDSDSDDSDESDETDENESTKKYNSHKLHRYLCESCEIRFVSKERLKNHVCYIKPVFGDNFKCSCLKEFTVASEFRSHIGKKPYSCCVCSMKFLELTNFIRHIRTHTNQKPYICNLCGKQFSQSSNLRNHCNIHLDYNAFKCDECKFSCKTLSGFAKHKSKHRNGYFDFHKYVDGKPTRVVPKTIPCPVCQKMFTFEGSMKMHMKSHDKVNSTLCIECGKNFESKHKLDNHFKACHEKPSKCSFCGKVFASALLLYAHRRIHKKTKTLFCCDICNKTFAMRNYLAQHMKTHSKEKRFFCSHCGKLFKVNASLKYHRKICG